MIYARSNGLEGDVAAFLWEAIRQIDRADLEWAAESLRSEANQGGEGSGNERVSD